MSTLADIRIAHCVQGGAGTCVLCRASLSVPLGPFPIVWHQGTRHPVCTRCVQRWAPAQLAVLEAERVGYEKTLDDLLDEWRLDHPLQFPLTHHDEGATA